MSLYHDYLRDTASCNGGSGDGGLAESCKPQQRPLPSKISTPCFEDIAVPRWRKHINDNFATYLHHALRHLRGERHRNDLKYRDFELHELAQEDIVAASIKICMLEAEKSTELKLDALAGEDAFVSLLIACADEDMVEVKALNDRIEASSGLSTLTTPLLLQILLVADLVVWSPPPQRNLFDLKPQRAVSCETWLWSHWLHSAPTGRKAEWVTPCGDMMSFVYRAQNTPEESLHAIYIFERVLQSDPGLPSTHLQAIENTVQMGPPAVVAHMLTRLPHEKITPRPHFLLTDAARRMAVDRPMGKASLGTQMLEALRPLNLDVNSIIDPRGKAANVSPLEQTPLHAATYHGNADAVVWCLRNGAKPTKNWFGKYQWEKVEDKDRKRVWELYKSEGWQIESEFWLGEIERKGSLLFTIVGIGVENITKGTK
ncbi:hypothetical protein F4808DRAFT_451665 [Astrocystis sublimbata]|nr:hypothetical protein F4808DRAFT_451665 [Astrocystis sublimbata]